MAVRVSVSVDQAALRAFIQQDVAAGVARAAGRCRDYAKANITVAGRVDTGQMRNATVAEVVRTNGNEISGRVVVEADHAIYQHEGTAGDGAGTIVPRRARVLRFRPRGSSTFVFTPQVRGVKGVPFLTDALERLSTSDFT